MGKVNPHNGDTGASLDNYDYMPVTVHEHTPRGDGMTLHTIDGDPDSDIEIYDDDREPHRSGNPPE